MDHVLRTSLICVLIGCAHEPPQPSWPRASSLVPAPSHRCTAAPGASCTCRDPEADADQAEAAPPAAGTKRFEIRVLPTSDLTWVELAGHGQLFKDVETGSGACAYVDLPVGEKAVLRYHVESPEPTRGVELDLEVHEYGAQKHTWYNTLRVDCGGGSVYCDRDGMREWLGRIHRLPHGVHDPCGSVKIEQPHWESPGSELPHPTAITVETTLDVYKFEPQFERGSSQCKLGGAQRAP
jgi:hypothetical protein